jgi:hypothetical protein
MRTVLHLNRTGPHSHLNRTKEEGEGTVAAAAAVPASAVLTPKRASQASSAANETTATFDLTHKRDKSNIIYQKLIKTDILVKSNPRLVIYLIIYIQDR